tara:strand:+ start:366 stop:584 length:219 start_codon:yes stop_codon:yes gene_type:complete
MTKKKKEIKETEIHTPTNDSMLGLAKRISMIEDKAEDTTGLVKDCIDVLKNYKTWLDDVDKQLKTIKSRLGL